MDDAAVVDVADVADVADVVVVVNVRPSCLELPSVVEQNLRELVAAFEQYLRGTFEVGVSAVSNLLPWPMRPVFRMQDLGSGCLHAGVSEMRVGAVEKSNTAASVRVSRGQLDSVGHPVEAAVERGGVDAMTDWDLSTMTETDTFRRA